MYLSNKKYHDFEINKYTFLVTGGAGFIGSNIVEYLLHFGAKKVKVLDNLSNGYYENIEKFIGYKNFEFINGDIRDLQTCYSAVENIDFISHQAALGSVPRSIKDPILTNQVNIDGFLNMIVAAKDSDNLIKFVYAASSSTYGDSIHLPKIEGIEGKPLSPYAITKAVNEQYAENFSKIYNFNSVGLRYFNVFGPRQNPNNPYAAVIPIFCKNFINNEVPIINGDGETSRDFTFIENVVQANIISFNFGLNSKNFENNKHQIFNVGCGLQISLNDIIKKLNLITGKNIKPRFLEERKGDVKHSLASIKKISSILQYDPIYNFDKGLEIVYNWYLKSKIF